MPIGPLSTIARLTIFMPATGFCLIMKAREGEKRLFRERSTLAVAKIAAGLQANLFSAISMRNGIGVRQRLRRRNVAHASASYT